MKQSSLDRLIATAKAHDHPPADATERAWAGIEASIAAGIGPSVPVTVATASATSGLGVKGLVIVGVAVLMGAGAAIVFASEPEPEPEKVVAAARPETTDAKVEPKRVAKAPDAAAPEVVPAPFVEPPATTPVEAPTVRAPSRRSSIATPEIASPPASDLAAQAQLLGEAWRALNAGETAKALERVREHARRYPNSPLAPEREACRIVAWCEEDRPWAAEKATAYLAAHGGTPASRVRQACSGGEKKE